nr:energy-coupling factor transporter ATPase [uncultured Butyricicoccus sp.]
MSEIIKTEALTYIYPSAEGEKKIALDGVDLSIARGEFVAVLGHNGSGKSTLASHFNGIRLPSGGAVYIDSMDTRDPERLYDIRKTCAMVFQNPDNQIVATVVEEDVAFALENLGIPPMEIRRRVDDALKAVGMYEFRRHAPHKLSGGQKQRVAIAGVIAMMPRCVVFDEPTAMLDPAGRREVMRVIRDLNSRLGITVVLITHHMDEAVQAQRVVVMHRGKVLMQGTPREIFTQVDALRAASLTVPQTIEVLFDLNNQLGSDLPIDALSVDECADILARYLRPDAAN